MSLAVITAPPNSTVGQWLLVAVPFVLLGGIVTVLVAAGRPVAAAWPVATARRAAASLGRLTGIPGWCAAGIGLATWSLAVALVGFMWDVAWHADDGRDKELLTPPHTMILVGLIGIGLAALAAIVLATLEREPAGRRLGRFQIPLSAVPLGILSVGAAVGFPLDDLWHRTYGIDVTMWSPTHLLMIGGASLAPIALWLMLAEGAPAAVRQDRLRLLRGALAGSVLLGLSTFQEEFDLGIPQWQALYHPVLVCAAAAVGLVLARVALGRGGAVITAVGFLGVRLLIAALLGPGLGHTAPRLPLYLGCALVVELAYAVPRPASPAGRALLAGGLVGTAGLASEWAWSHIVGIDSWQLDLVPAVWTAGAAAVVGALLGAALGGVGIGVPQGLPRPVLLGAGVALAALLAVPLPRNGVAASATVSARPVTDPVPAVDRQGLASLYTEVEVTVRTDPADVAAGADRFLVIAWQGGGIVRRPLVERSPGVYVTDGTVPTGGGWKSMVALDHRDVIAAVPVSFPRDPDYGLDTITPDPARPLAFVPASQYLMREDHSGSPLPRILAYVGFVVVVGVWLVLLTTVGSALGRRGGGRPGAPPTRGLLGRRRPLRTGVAAAG